MLIGQTKMPEGDPTDRCYVPGDPVFFTWDNILALRMSMVEKCKDMRVRRDDCAFVAHSPSVLGLHLASLGAERLGEKLFQDVFQNQQWGNLLLGVRVQYNKDIPPNTLLMIHGDLSNPNVLGRLVTRYHHTETT